MSEFTEDTNLAARVRARDSKALGQIVQSYLGQVFRAARGAGLDVARAEDVTQSTFTTFLEKAHTFEGRSQVRTWIFGILYRKIAEARRHLSRDLQQDDIDEVVEGRFRSDGMWASPPREVESEVQDAQVREMLQGCMEGLPHKQRVAFYLREAEDLPSDEICKVLDVSRTNLGVILFRARNRLRECLETKGVSGS